MSTSAPIQQAIILAAGEGSRFQPFQTRQHHKSGMRLMGEQIVVKTIRALAAMKMAEIIVIRAARDEQLEALILEALAAQPLGTDQPPTLRFVTQAQALGMANALLSARELLQQRFLVVNPQQLNIQDHWQNYLNQIQTDPQTATADVVLFAQPTDQPHKYGMLQLEGRRVVKVVEKPKDLTGLSNERIMGNYVVSLDFISHLAQLETTEYQWEAALDSYTGTHPIMAVATSAAGLSLKYVWDVFSIAHYLFTKFAPAPQIHPTAEIHPTAIITGPVVIEAGAKIYEYSLIQGPCYIGKNVVVGSYCKVRAETVLEEGVEIQNQVEVRHALFGKGAHVHSGFIGDSIIGENVRIGTGFITANKRLDRRSVKVPIKSAMVDTGFVGFGTLVGDKAKIGIHVGTNPGTLIPAESLIGPGQIVSNPRV